MWQFAQGTSKRGFRNEEAVGRWKGCEAKGAVSEQQMGYEPVYEWPSKMGHMMWIRKHVRHGRMRKEKEG